MKREQIIEILKEYMDMEWDECADAILALPMDVSNNEIERKIIELQERLSVRDTIIDKQRVLIATLKEGNKVPWWKSTLRYCIICGVCTLCFISGIMYNQGESVWSFIITIGYFIIVFTLWRTEK
jgi:hypothetical protein